MSDRGREATCALPTYLSWGIDGDDGPWVERAECDGPSPCGWSRDLSEHNVAAAGGINSVEFAALDAERRAHTPSPARVTPCRDDCVLVKPHHGWCEFPPASQTTPDGT